MPPEETVFNQGYLRGELISAWTHCKQVAVGGSVLVWLALMLGEDRVSPRDRNRLIGVDMEKTRKAWQQFKLARVNIHVLAGQYSKGETGEYWEVSINTRLDTATIKHVKKNTVMGYRVMEGPSLTRILIQLEVFGWNAEESNQ